MSASAKKIQAVDVPKETDLAPECNIIINTGILLNFLEKLVVKCPECGCNVVITHENKMKYGLTHFFKAECHCDCTKLCEWASTMPTSHNVNTRQRGVKPYEINMRAMIAFREIGRDYKSIQEFCKLMNMPPPMDRKVYRKSFSRLYRACSKVGQNSLEDAAEQVFGIADDPGIQNVTASFDGTWQRRGYSSLNGVVTCVSNGKVVDYEVLSKVCRQCKYWNRHTSAKGYDDWKLHHNCLINHTGSAGSMEVEGVTRMFKRSVETKKLRYTTYLGDGDSKSFQTVAASNVYPGYVLKKAECVGHVQKRVGSRLRSYKQKYKGIVLPDGKRLCGANRLTEKVMNTIQNYYGMVIRTNVGNLYQMKKGIAAILFHCSEDLHSNGEPNNESRHKFCPQGKDSWCKYQSGKVTGASTYKSKINIPVAVCDVIKPIFSHDDFFFFINIKGYNLNHFGSR